MHKKEKKLAKEKGARVDLCHESRNMVDAAETRTRRLLFRGARGALIKKWFRRNREQSSLWVNRHLSLNAVKHPTPRLSPTPYSL